MKSITILLTLCAISLTAHVKCQEKERDAYGTGYVVTVENDTNYGTFLIDNRIKSSGKIGIRDEFQNVKYYDGNELSSFVKNTRLYLPKEFTERRFLLKRYGFLRVQETGSMNLYAIGGADHSLGTSTPIRYLIEKNGKIVEVKEFLFLFQALKWYKDAPEITKKLKRGKYNYSKTPNLVRDYNEVMSIKNK